MSADRPEWARGSAAHYDDAAYYAATYAGRHGDVSYYVGLALDHGGPVLEYGCGNGRIALPIARGRVPVTGVDLSRPMLDDFAQRLRGEAREVRQRVQLRHGDMRRVRLRERFGLVLCTFNTFLHLYTRDDVERFLARVHAHLKPRGRFVVDVSVPDAAELARDPARAYRVPRFRHAGTQQVVRYAERFDYDPIAQVLVVDMEFEPRDVPEQRWTTPLAHRQFYPRELEALLHYNGFEVVTEHGDFEPTPPHSASESIIFTCKKRGRRR